MSNINVVTTAFTSYIPSPCFSFFEFYPNYMIGGGTGYLSNLALVCFTTQKSYRKVQGLQGITNDKLKVKLNLLQSTRYNCWVRRESARLSLGVRKSKHIKQKKHLVREANNFEFKILIILFIVTLYLLLIYKVTGTAAEIEKDFLMSFLFNCTNVVVQWDSTFRISL